MIHGTDEDGGIRAAERSALSAPEVPAVPGFGGCRVRVHTLGGFAVLINGASLRFSRKTPRKPLALLKALIALGGREVSEERVADALWPGAEGDAAAQVVATTLHRLRRLIGASALLRRDGRISLSGQRVWVDVWALERELARLEQACTAQAPERIACAARRVLVRYRGEFLDNDRDETWMLSLRDRLRRRILHGLGSAAVRLTRAAHYDLALSCCQRVVDIDPLAEAAYRCMMQSYLALDRRSDALGVYQRCRQMLAAHLGIAPGPDTEDLIRAPRVGTACFLPRS